MAALASIAPTVPGPPTLLAAGPPTGSPSTPSSLLWLPLTSPPSRAPTPPTPSRPSSPCAPP
eukprot:5959064-Prymnesium_polylepis.2